MNVSKRIKIFLLIFFISFSSRDVVICNTSLRNNEWVSEQTDAEKLSRAVDYFQSGKYHEALIWFSKLNKKYALNLRFQAYMGVCYFYDEDYERAIETLEPRLSQLKVFAPHELAVYYYCVAESYFRLKKYIDAVPLYEKHTLLCYNNEKGESFFRIGICYKHLGEIEIAQEYFIEALAYLRHFNNQDRLNYIEKELEDNADN